MSNVVEYLAFFLIAIILVTIIFYLITYNATLNLEKRIKKYSIDSIKETNVSLFDMFYEMYLNARRKLSAIFKKSAVLKDYAKKYSKYITYENEKDTEEMDFISNKFLIALFFSFLALFADIIVPNMFGISQVIFFGLIGFFVIDIYFLVYDKVKKKKVEQDLLNAIIIMNNAFRSGRSMLQAIEIVPTELTGPIAQEFKKMHLEISYGLSVDVVFDRFSKRVDSPEVSYITSSLSILNKTGGNIIKVFSSIEAMLFNKRKLKEEMQSLTSSSKMLSNFLLALPPLFIVGLFLVSSKYGILEIITNPTLMIESLKDNYFTPLFESIPGLFIVMLIILFYALYILAVKKIMKVRFE